MLFIYYIIRIKQLSIIIRRDNYRVQFPLIRDGQAQKGKVDLSKITQQFGDSKSLFSNYHTKTASENGVKIPCASPVSSVVSV